MAVVIAAEMQLTVRFEEVSEEELDVVVAGEELEVSSARTPI